MQGLLYACSRCGQPQRGLRVLSDLQQSGIFIPLRTYHQAMGLFIHSPDGVVVVRAGQGSNVQHSAEVQCCWLRGEAAKLLSC